MFNTSAVTASSPRKIRAALEQETLELITFQSPQAVRQLETAGRLIPTSEHAHPAFLDAYAWMAQQMNDRLVTRGETAVWLWASITKRDLRLSKDSGDIELRCRIPRERVLLGSFGLWHFVLNRWFLPEDIESELESDFEDDDYSEANIESSWSQIFDIPHEIDHRYAIQATAHYIDLSDVVSIRR